MSADPAKLHHLIFYAIDKGSPHSLALDVSTNTIGKIGAIKLTALGMMGQGIADMWQLIDTFASSYASATSPSDDAKQKCTTPMEVWKAVCKASAIDPVPPDSVLDAVGEVS